MTLSVNKKFSRACAYGNEVIDFFQKLLRGDNDFTRDIEKHSN